MQDHYSTQQHQHALLNAVHEMLSQLNDRQMDIEHSRTTTAGPCNPATAQSEELYEMLSILVGGIETLTNDEQCLANEALQMQTAIPTLAEEFSKVKLSVEESNAFLERVRHNQAILNQDLLSLQEKINGLQCVFYDGTLVWKIANFHEKMKDNQELTYYSVSITSTNNM
ncbi:unnamed protein product [Rotaria sordida]|uniref:Uncharacterized protein n=1 Tax=Rotaria sordida TaxID=392033 RepID=A0A815H254_9BILA|nr:unnamed protein product [Rotaria sordida]CAF1599199.1 unnamed protein product [Rotaria sordida]